MLNCDNIPNIDSSMHGSLLKRPREEEDDDSSDSSSSRPRTESMDSFISASNEYPFQDSDSPSIEGQINEIYLENFMNHKKCLLTLGPGLNFITGANGAGKSAFAVGLQFCLGGKTDRSSKVSSLIREGSPGPAKVRVTLANEGSDAYRPDIFGKSISIERRVYVSGVSQYSISTHDNQVMWYMNNHLCLCNSLTLILHIL